MLHYSGHCRADNSFEYKVHSEPGEYTPSSYYNSLSDSLRNTIIANALATMESLQGIIINIPP